MVTEHSISGKNEMIALANEFNKLKEKANMNTPNLDELEKYAPKE